MHARTALLVAALLASALCTAEERSRTAEPEGLLFIEVWTKEDGVALSGTPPRMMIDFPTYDLSGFILSSYTPVENLSTAIAIVGVGYTLSGDMGGGASSYLQPLAGTPADAGPLRILTIDNETVRFEIDGLSREVGPGESWERSSEETRTGDGFQMRVTTKVSVKNHGRVAVHAGEGVRI